MEDQMVSLGKTDMILGKLSKGKTIPDSSLHLPGVFMESKLPQGEDS